MDVFTEDAVRAFGGERRITRAHVRVRAATCPFPEIHRCLPPSGSVLDLGCGHGLGAIRMALAEPDRQVLGVDIDADKVAVARRAANAAGVTDRVEFRIVESSWRPAERSVDAVLVADVLYLLPPAEQTELIGACLRAVTAGGTVVVKEMASRPRWKRRFTILQEQLSVRVLGITAGSGVHLPDPDDLEDALRATGAAVRRLDLSHGRPHPHLVLVARTDR